MCSNIPCKGFVPLRLLLLDCCKAYIKGKLFYKINKIPRTQDLYTTQVYINTISIHLH